MQNTCYWISRQLYVKHFAAIFWNVVLTPLAKSMRRICPQIDCMDSGMLWLWTAFSALWATDLHFRAYCHPFITSLYIIINISELTTIRRDTSWYTVSLSTPSRSIALCSKAAKLLSSSVNSLSWPPGPIRTWCLDNQKGSHGGGDGRAFPSFAAPSMCSSSLSK